MDAAGPRVLVVLYYAMGRVGLWKKRWPLAGRKHTLLNPFISLLPDGVCEVLHLLKS